MRILLTKISDNRHALEVVRRDGSRDSVELVTREALMHDFLHYAFESLLPTQGGFWGVLASGKSFADLNDRSGESVRDHAETLAATEGAVGMLTGLISLSEDEAFARLCWVHECQQRTPPPWATKAFLSKLLERMRQLQGQWKATPFRESMEILWTEDQGISQQA